MNDQPTATTDWQARAEKAEAEVERLKTVNTELLQRSSSDATMQAQFALESRDRTREELERLKAACAEMTKALHECARELRYSPTYPVAQDERERKRVIEQAQAALADSSGSDYVPKSELDALKKALDQISKATNPDDEGCYRADDREGCLDTVHSIATDALKRD